MKKTSGYQWRSTSPKNTQAIAKKIASHLMAGDVVALKGELGAGKTTFVQGIASGLGIKRGSEVSSPTFVVIHEYEGRLKMYHLDWYRLDRVQGVDAAMAEECFGSGGVTLVEWPERGADILPENRIDIEIKHVDPRTRELKLHFCGNKKRTLSI